MDRDSYRIRRETLVELILRFCAHCVRMMDKYCGRFKLMGASYCRIDYFCVVGIGRLRLSRFRLTCSSGSLVYAGGVYVSSTTAKGLTSSRLSLFHYHSCTPSCKRRNLYPISLRYTSPQSTPRYNLAPQNPSKPRQTSSNLLKPRQTSKTISTLARLNVNFTEPQKTSSNLSSNLVKPRQTISTLSRLNVNFTSPTPYQQPSESHLRSASTIELERYMARLPIHRTEATSERYTSTSHREPRYYEDTSTLPVASSLPLRRIPVSS